MRDVISFFFGMQGYFPQIYLFIFAALKTTGIVLLGWSAASFLKSRSAAARCWVWRCTLLGVFALLAFDFGPQAMWRFRLRFTVPLTLKSYQTMGRDAIALGLLRKDINQIVEEKRERELTAPIPPWQAETRAFTVSDLRARPWKQIEAWLPAIWWGVAGVMILFAAFRITAGVLWLRWNNSKADDAMVILSDRIARRLAIQVRPGLLITSKIHSPLVLGVKRPEVYLPPAAFSWSEEKLRAVFLHELSHWKRRDNLWKYFGRVTSCLFWWNPLVALAVRRMNTGAEEAADDAVLLHQYEAKAYATALVEIASAGGNERISAAGISMTGHGSLEKRIKALLVYNPWRGRIGWQGMALIVVLLLGSVSGASIFLAGAATSGDVRKTNPLTLTAGQRADLERIANANIKRINALRFVHFKMESTETHESRGVILKSPQPTKLEAWIDEWTGIHRLEFRPMVSRWTDGTTPFWIEESTEVDDGKSKKPEIQSYLGLYEMNDMIGITKSMLAAPTVDNDRLLTVDEVAREGKPLIQIREQFLNKDGAVSQQKTFLVDPSQDDMLVFYELAWPAYRPKEEPIQWILKKTGLTENGVLYPEITGSVSSFDGEKTITEKKVISLQVLSSLPAGITNAP